MKRFKVIFICLALLLGAGVTAANQPSHGYILGPGDVLQISVWGHADLGQVVEVRPDGMISFPLVGELEVAGLRPAEVSDSISRGLSKFVKDTGVTVTVKEFRALTIQVLGQVRNPGLYRLRPPVTVSAAIAAAGGFTPEANLVDLSARGGPTADRHLADGDQIVVPELPKVAVLGEVRAPGLVVASPGDGVFELLAKAGGANPDADLSRVELTVNRPVGPDSQPKPEPALVNRLLDLTNGVPKGIDNQLPDSGPPESLTALTGLGRVVVTVPRQRKAIVLGEVRLPGEVVVRSGDSVLELLARAGGSTADADLSKVEIASQPTEMATPDTMVVDLTSAPGGSHRLSLPGSGRLAVRVPRITRQVTILGQVRRPGTYPLADGGRLLALLGAAGGPTERASLEKVRVYRGGALQDPLATVMGRDDLLFEGEARQNPLLTTNDIVFVPETDRISWDKVLKFLTGLNLVHDLFE